MMWISYNIIWDYHVSNGPDQKKYETWTSICKLVDNSLTTGMRLTSHYCLWNHLKFKIYVLNKFRKLLLKNNFSK